MTRYVKDPDDVADYGWDWAPHLAQGETITTSTWEVDDGLLSTAYPDSKTDTTTTVWLSGGTNGRTYAVTNHVVTSQGREKDKAFLVMVSDATPPTSGNSGSGGNLGNLQAQVYGFTDHGNVSGAVTFSGPIGSHWFDATAATTITLDGFTDGQVVSLLCFTGAEDVTVTGLPDLELADGLVVSAIRARGVWVTGGGGGGTPVVPDTTSPSAVTTLVATGGEEQIVLSWSASTDAENTVSYRYRVWLTSGGASGAWTTTTSTGATVTGLAAGAYTAEVYAYSAGGASATDTAAATVTAAVLPYDETVLSDSPTYYWPLDDAPGTTSPRQIGSHVGAITYSLSGVAFGGTTLGGSGTAATFDGTGTGIGVNVGPASGLGIFTFETIVTITGSGNQGLFGHPTGYYPSAHKSGSQVTAVMAGQVVNGTGAPSTFHLAIRSTPQGSGNPKLEIFINGSNSGEAILNGPSLAAYTALNLGREKYADAALTGRMSDFAVYEGVALSDARILAHAQAAGKA